MRSPRSRLAAFTLIELMIVVALVAIIIALAAPSLLAIGRYWHGFRPA